jgi:glycosyltransferase involved in cell wall biosynthesis
MSAPLCIVNPYEHGGGAEYQISLLIDALVQAERYDIYYLARFADERERTRNYRIVRIGGGGKIPRLGYSMDAAALYRALSKIRPRLIYQRVGGAYTGICAFYARRHGIPLIWHVAHDTDVARRSLDPGRNFLRVRLEKWALNFGVRRADCVVVQTQHQARLLEKNFARTADAVIPNFHPAPRELLDKSGAVTVVWIANLKPWKQPEVFARLARSLRDCHGVNFVMVGAAAGAGANQAWQQSLMTDIAAAPNLEYVGPKSHSEVNELLARAHIFVNTSAHEGFPNTFIQAWLRDVAVVSLNVDPDGVLDGKQVGIIAHSEPALCQSGRRLIEDAGARAAFVRRAREHALLHHSLRNVQDLTRLIVSRGGSAG